MQDRPTASPAGLQKFIDHYHRVTLLVGGALLVFAWSRIISVASRAHFARSMLLLAGLSILFMVLARQQRDTAQRETLTTPWPWVALCLYFAALTLWNLVFFDHILASGVSSDIFRNALRTFQAPVYGVAKTVTFWQFAAIAAFALGYARVLGWSLARADKTTQVVLAFMALELVTILGAAWQSGHGHWPDARLIHGGFDALLGQFPTLDEVWSQWNERMTQFPTRASHYPPGPLFIALLEARVGLPGLWMGASVLSVLLCMPLLARLSKGLGLPPRVTVLACAWLVTSAAFMSFPLIANAAPTAFLALAALTAVAAALRGTARHALLAGVIIGVHGLYSFTVVFVIALLMLWLLLAAVVGALDAKRAVHCTVLVLLGSVGLWLLVWALSGFNLATCLHQALNNNRDAMSRELFEVPIRYTLRASGNLLAYIAYLGPCAALYAVLGTLRGSRDYPLFHAFALASILAVLGAALSGSFFLETERIWMFFTPALVMTAAVGLHGTDRSAALATPARHTLIASALLGATLTVTMSQDMPPDEQVSAAAWQRARALLGHERPVATPPTQRAQ